MFKKATRKQAKLRLALAGPTNSGKTWSALLMATGMAELLGSRIAFIDTEKRAHLYGNDFDFDLVEMSAPYSVESYIKNIIEAEKNGYKILIIDSLSHAWDGEGGVLDLVTKAGGQYQKGWDKGTPAQNKLINTIMLSNMHIIVCVRAKMEHVLEPTINKNGQTVMSPKKVGLAPVQRKDLEYEFTVWMTMNADHVAFFDKDNTRMYTDQYLTPVKEMGIKFVEWLNSGEAVPAQGKQPEVKITPVAIDFEAKIRASLTVGEIHNVLKSIPSADRNDYIGLATEQKKKIQAAEAELMHKFNSGDNLSAGDVDQTINKIKEAA